MATVGNQIVFRTCTSEAYAALTTKSADSVYFLSDTKQLFVGESEYTKSTKTLNAAPTSATPGDDGALYAYNGSLYLCKINGSTYNWTRVANVNDYAGTVTSITTGEGLANATGDDNPITTAGTIKHAIPTGAAATADSGAAQTPSFGGTFSVQTVGTDKFGHVTSITDSNVTLPNETAVSVDDVTGTAVTLDYGDTFTVVTNVAKGTGSHELEKTAVTFTLPASDNTDTTYTLTSTSEGKITVTPSTGSAYDVSIDGWGDLAKKSEITSVFKFKGTVATTAALPSSGQTEGDVYFVTSDQSEYVWIDGSPAGSWEKLGPVIDLSGYANRADVIGRVTGATGEVPQFNADGELTSTGFTLGCSVPADAVFTDTVYTPPTYGANTTGFYKFATDANGYVSSVTAVALSDLTGLGAADTQYVDDAVAAATLVWHGATDPTT